MQTAPAQPPTDVEEAGPSLRDILSVLWRRWLPIIAFTLLGVAAAFLLTATMPPRYTATATAVVNPTVTDNPAAAQSQDMLAKSRAGQYQELAESHLVAERVAEDMPDAGDAQALRGAVSVSNPSNSSMLKVTVESSDPQQAERLANAWIDALTQEADRLAKADGGDPQVEINRMIPAIAPTAPSSPNLRLNVILGTALGLLVGLAVAVLQELLDRRLRGVEDLRALGLTPLGALPAVGNVGRGRRLLVSDEATQNPRLFGIREAFNSLRINLQFMNPDSPPRVITVTSASPGDGKSTVAANLASTMAASGVPVVLVDADLRRPTIATTFGLPEGAGLSDVVVGRAQFRDVLHAPVEHPDLVVLPAGQLPPNPTELLTSERFGQALSVLAETHMVIVDAPPLLAVSDAAVIATRFDGAILVVDARSTTRDQVAQAVSAMQQVHATVIGALLNRVPSQGRGSSYGYYRTDYMSKTPSASEEITQSKNPSSGS
ncbi:polysaccharide biosynthesis tyrosine autokinase [Micrococcus luteus]|uniref:polysaccharide biosynthesis tyrosine autokinase n=1 Tax=Micrococcus luteus TaxID=1270 RepID=UPI0038203EA4